MDDSASSDYDDIDSLPTTSSVISSSDSGSESDAQREWEASLEQLQLLLTIVLIPFAGKYFGRKFAFWSWARYMEWAHNRWFGWDCYFMFLAPMTTFLSTELAHTVEFAL
ncbi:hypothetical protein P8C59_004745 [Phyllachora maydis]|uniref:Uncharacterized protein n=1 Tax=Phyllachora maydis TaxID=1825666 RepID=A0AAD9MDU1_9PEZI|nr:hypothetical protein P8C59_004745 [Phyllachora maydis]